MSTKNPEWYELPKKQWIKLREDGYTSYRDSQKQKLYDAENSFKSCCFNGENTKFFSIEEISQYVNKLVKSAWVILLY